MDQDREDEGISDVVEGMDHTQGVDECGMYGITRFSPSMDVSLERLGICPRQDAVHPTFTTVESRLESFSSWPLHIKLRPNALSDAGFYYTGTGDRTVCFQCGGGLKDWEENDDPWKEHARYFSKCTYLIQKKGRDFVDEVLGKTVKPQVATSVPVQQQPAGATPTTSSSEENTLTSEWSVSDVGSSGSSDYGSGGSFLDEGCSSQESTQETSRDCKQEKTDAKVINDQRACKICYSEEVGVVFLPCGHLVACVNCAPSLKTCAVCRKPFSATVRAYLS